MGGSIVLNTPESVKIRLEKDLAKLIKENIGKGPSEISVNINGSLVVCRIYGFLTKAEELIVKAGYPEKVTEFRNIYISQCVGDIEKIFENTLCRTVKRFFSSYLTDVNEACWIIILE